ncbi:MAG: hypothetical protein A2W90_02660 [Bacteroidetes bacterium GWF2_42_66]|nr:MAG: hypothetical protein A2W92_19700 [Bacteroidetes bacterium GWA2_42_15]OFY01252.1 MAG: hypothetical protein A2W89_16145 [Bacteroidetes bacterium GWE2_42_39]OFY42095.1 MAG: hypothetical protein A2W90_02660 [Bacteroidetes bacterium GWF2_42_66]
MLRKRNLGNPNKSNKYQKSSHVKLIWFKYQADNLYNYFCFNTKTKGTYIINVSSFVCFKKPFIPVEMIQNLFNLKKKLKIYNTK